MGVSQRTGRLGPSLVSLALLCLLQTASVLAVFANNFDAYPTGTRNCLNASAIASGCDGDSVSSMNSCLCSNTGNFVIASAECIGQSDYGDLEAAYATMASACSYSNTPLTVSQMDFLSAGNGTLSSSVAPTSTTLSSTLKASVTHATSISTGHVKTATGTAGTPTNTGTSGSSGNSGGMSSTTKTVIIAAAAAAGVAILATFAYFLMRMRRNGQSGEEHRPMLGNDNSPGNKSGTELSHMPDGSGSLHDWKAGALPAYSDAKWVQDPYLTSPTPAKYQQLASVYELPVQENVQMPIEMPATPMVAEATPAYYPRAGQSRSPGTNAYR
ncbi:hypothetical protein SEPCBS119000_003007 [Sporothrix epigloea]|uniref:Extracellular membrane protein CFEM domain-containing protein n=1 Tax=Sporothrix epigloea TaxID=1892477 RepID=A0ABP0DL40_9PEZI